MTTLARQAADLLPEPPAAHDAFGYLAWEELVVTTARRLAWIAGGDLGAIPAGDDLHRDAATDRLDAATLLALAAVVAATSDVQACEAALARAVADCRARIAVPAQRTRGCLHVAGRRRTPADHARLLGAHVR